MKGPLRPQASTHGNAHLPPWVPPPHSQNGGWVRTWAGGQSQPLGPYPRPMGQGWPGRQSCFQGEMQRETPPAHKLILGYTTDHGPQGVNPLILRLTSHSGQMDPGCDSPAPETLSAPPQPVHRCLWSCPLGGCPTPGKQHPWALERPVTDELRQCPVPYPVSLICLMG